MIFHYIIIYTLIGFLLASWNNRRKYFTDQGKATCHFLVTWALWFFLLPIYLLGRHVRSISKEVPKGICPKCGYEEGKK